MKVIIRYGYDEDDESVDENWKFKTLSDLKKFLISNGGYLHYNHEEECFIISNTEI